MKNKNQSGFIRLIVVIIVGLIIAYYFGYNPAEVWSHWVLPGVTFAWGIIVTIVKVLVNLLDKALVAGKDIKDIFAK